jgi:hypothetical protein
LGGLERTAGKTINDVNVPSASAPQSLDTSSATTSVNVNTKQSCTFCVIASREAARQSIRIQRDSEKGWIATSRQVVTRDDESPSFFY